MMWSEDVSLDKRIVMLNRPPPYFPQNQLSPPDPNRYRKFKLVIAAASIGLLILLTGIGIGIYYLIMWLAK